MINLLVQAKKPGRQKIVAKPVKKEETEVEEAWRDNFKKQAAKRIGDSKRRKQAQQHSPGQRVPPKTKNYGEAYNSILDKQSARILGRPDTPKKQKLSITPAGKKALKKGDQKLSITAKGRAAVKEGAKELEARNAAKADKKQQGGSLRHKVWPASASMKMPKEDMSLAPKGKGRKAAKALYKEGGNEGPPTPKFKPLKHKVWSADASIPAGARPKDPGKIPKYKVKKSGMASGPPTNETTHFGDVLSNRRSQKGQCHRHHK